MKKFLFTVLIFTILLSLISLYSYWIVEKYYHSGSGYSEVDLSYEHYLLADSHANALEGEVEKYGIHHFAYDSDSYVDMERKLSYLVNKAEVKTVFITLSDQALSIYREQQNNLDRSIQYATIDNYDNKYEYAKVKYIERYITLLNPKVRSLIRIYTQELILDFINRLILLNENKNSDDIDNRSTENKTWVELSRNERTQKAKNRFEVQFPSFQESEVLKKALEDIIEISQKNDVRLIGIKFPMSNEYLNLKDGRRFSGSDMLSSVGYEVYNLEKIFVDKQYKFQDQDHLNDKAGEDLSKIFNQILLNKNLGL